MEWGLAVLGIGLLFVIWTMDWSFREIRRKVARLDQKLNLILDHLNLEYEEYSALSERVKEIARDPGRKIEAIKAYREETGAGLREAKEAVEAWMDSVER